MPDLYLGKAVSNDDRDALASHARNPLQSERDDRCQDSRRHFSFVAGAAASPRLPLLSSSGHARPCEPRFRNPRKAVVPPGRPMQSDRCPTHSVREQPRAILDAVGGPDAFHMRRQAKRPKIARLKRGLGHRRGVGRTPCTDPAETGPRVT